MVKMKSMFAIGFAFTSLLSMFNSIFDGRVVAKLPFTPITWLQVLSLPASCHVCFRFDSEMANHYFEYVYNWLLCCREWIKESYEVDGVCGKREPDP